MVDVRFFESPMTQSRLNKKNLIVIAGLRYVKGVDLSLKTFKSLSDQDPNWVLNICGDGPEMHSLKCWCKDHGISNKVRFHGSVTRSELRNIINLSCICMIDSRNEGFPKAMLEALAGGCYIVHSGKGECSRVLRGFGFEYNVFNADVVSKHILTISSDVDNFMLKTQEALKIANKYSIEAYCSRIEGSYKRWLRPESCG